MSHPHFCLHIIDCPMWNTSEHMAHFFRRSLYRIFFFTFGVDKAIISCSLTGMVPEQAKQTETHQQDAELAEPRWLPPPGAAHGPRRPPLGSGGGRRTPPLPTLLRWELSFLRPLSPLPAASLLCGKLVNFAFLFCWTAGSSSNSWAR